jgi:uncharacterized protein YydD (DUF2326 family)
MSDKWRKHFNSRFRKSQQHGFQYICCLNSDSIPWKEFDKQFNLRRYVRLELTDADDTGSLLA